MTKILVGSRALAYSIFMEDKYNKDVDMWVSEGVEPEFGTDTSIIPEGILDLVETLPTYGLGYKIASLDSLYTIKCSHLGWDILWEKHKKYCLLMKANGASIIPELYEALVEHWKEVHGDKGFLSLYQPKKEFFTDNVDYKYDHDYLHELVAYPNPPIYTKCLQDGQAVMIDKGKFFSMSKEDQLRMFREEVTVIAVERWLIPQGNTPKKYSKVKWQEAYGYALRKTTTSLTKGWATDFVIENLDKLVVPDFNYFKHILETIPEGAKIMAKQLSVEESNAIIQEMMDLYIATYTGTKRWIPNDLKEFLEDYVCHGVPLDGYEHIESEGGGEGGAKACHTVFKWKGQAYMINYSYYSYHGYDYYDDALTMVEPTEKTVTVWG